MKAKELIEKLSKVDPELDVEVVDSYGAYHMVKGDVFVSNLGDEPITTVLISCKEKE